MTLINCLRELIHSVDLCALPSFRGRGPKVKVRRGAYCYASNFVASYSVAKGESVLLLLLMPMFRLNRLLSFLPPYIPERAPCFFKRGKQLFFHRKSRRSDSLARIHRLCSIHWLGLVIHPRTLRSRMDIQWRRDYHDILFDTWHLRCCFLVLSIVI